MSIEYLKNHLLETLNAKSKTKSGVKSGPRPKSSIKLSDVHFVLTVPAIWDDKAKLLMREAAMDVSNRI